jgi:hypothetical protein
VTAISVTEQPKIIRWEIPPTAKRTGGNSFSRFQALADELRAHAGQWAVIYDGHSKSFTGLANHIRQGSVRCFTPCGDFDATTRSRDGHYIVYARYVGDGGAL